MFYSKLLFVFLFIQYFVFFIAQEAPPPESPISYDFHTALDLGVVKDEDASFLNSINTEDGTIRILEEGSGIVAIVSPEKLIEFKEILNKRAIKFKVLSENVQTAIDQEQKTPTARQGEKYGWDTYYNYNNIVEWMKQLEKANPGKVKVVVGGTTYEKRNIYGIKISFGSNKKIAVLEGGIHGREWISPATVTYIADQILKSKDKNIRKIVENFEWHIFPVLNPDGYEFSRFSDRFWRKNRKKLDSCTGVDLNRNFETKNTFQVGKVKCAENYGGPNEFSEIETRTFSEYIGQLNNRVVYLAFHSFSQYLMYPYGTRDNEDHAKHEQLLRKATEVLKNRFNTKYKYGNIKTTMAQGDIYGLSIDWAFGKLKIPYSFVYELRPANNNKKIGFLLPNKEIIPTAQETLDSIIVILEEAVQWVPPKGCFNLCSKLFQ